MSTSIATYELVAFRDEAEPMPLRVVLSEPIPSEKMSPAWECTVDMRPLWMTPFVIYGEGSFQALCLAAKHAVQTLDTFVSQGGRLEHADGDSFDPDVFGFRLLQR